MTDLRLGDCLDVMRSMPDGSVDAVVTDPPAGIAFMGKAWDSFGGRSNPNAERDRDRGNRGPGAGLGKQPFAYSGSALPKGRAERDAFVAFLSERMAEARRVSRPGSYALVWALPRTSHWAALALEDAGWVIRDRVSHLFGTGFPKGKACLKPACEDWWLAWNPARKVTPLNIDECRVESAESTVRNTTGARNGHSMNCAHDGSLSKAGVYGTDSGRWPANVTHDGSPDVMEAFAAFGERTSNPGKYSSESANVGYGGLPSRKAGTVVSDGDSGTAARFFYCAKASRKDRNEGLEGFEPKFSPTMGNGIGGKEHDPETATRKQNTHPTVKNTELMIWLCRLITPPGGTVLDPFAGSGSTGKACAAEGFGFVGIEQSPEYHAIARRRIDDALKVKAAS